MKSRGACTGARVVAFGVLAGGALADEPPPQTEQQVQDRLAKPNYALGGYYLGVEGLVAVENSLLISGSSMMVSGGFDIRLGYRHNRWLATEISGGYIHKYSGTNFLAWGMSVNERLYLSRSRVQPYLTVGAGFQQLRSRNSTQTFGIVSFDPKFTMRFGLGTEIYASENVVFTIFANYFMPIASGNQLDFLTAGAVPAGSTNFDFATAGIGMQFF